MPSPAAPGWRRSRSRRARVRRVSRSRGTHPSARSASTCRAAVVRPAPRDPAAAVDQVAQDVALDRSGVRLTKRCASGPGARRRPAHTLAQGPRSLLPGVRRRGRDHLRQVPSLSPRKAARSSGHDSSSRGPAARQPFGALFTQDPVSRRVSIPGDGNHGVPGAGSPSRGSSARQLLRSSGGHG